jgi:hypothetical protein
MLCHQLQVCKTPQNTKEDPEDSEPAADGDIKMEYSSD